MVYPNTRTVDPPKTKFSPELTRASRARLGRYGFTDIMREGSGAVVLPSGQKDVVVSMYAHGYLSSIRLSAQPTPSFPYFLLRASIQS